MLEAGVSFVGGPIGSRLLRLVFCRPEGGQSAKDSSRRRPGHGHCGVRAGGHGNSCTRRDGAESLGERLLYSVQAGRDPDPGAGGTVCFLLPLSRRRMESSAGFTPTRLTRATRIILDWTPRMKSEARDDIVSGELVVPVNREVQLLMHAKDVGHSFYVRELRIQQDFVPGTGPRRPFHSHENRQIRNCLHAIVRIGPLQHEGVPEREVAGRLRPVVERTGSTVTAVNSPRCRG